MRTGCGVFWSAFLSDTSYYAMAFWWAELWAHKWKNGSRGRLHFRGFSILHELLGILPWRCLVLCQEWYIVRLSSRIAHTQCLLRPRKCGASRPRITPTKHVLQWCVRASESGALPLWGGAPPGCRAIYLQGIDADLLAFCLWLMPPLHMHEDWWHCIIGPQWRYIGGKTRTTIGGDEVCVSGFLHYDVDNCSIPIGHLCLSGYTDYDISGRRTSERTSGQWWVVDWQAVSLFHVTSVTSAP